MNMKSTQHIGAGGLQGIRPRASAGSSAVALGLALVCEGGLAATSPATTPQAAPPPPKPEPVLIQELPFPPTAPSDAEDACASAINPQGTGCISAVMDAIIEGPAYMGDGKHVLLAIEFAGAPASPNPASIYNGPQVIAIKEDGGRFRMATLGNASHAVFPPQL
jgi:hypothetical protein